MNPTTTRTSPARRPATWTALLSLGLVPLASCGSTQLALVDETYGFEHLNAEHGLHLTSARAVISPQPGRSESTFRFFLELVAVNTGDTAWAIERDGFGLTVMPCGGEQCQAATVELGDTAAQLISVAADSRAELRVPVVIRADTPNLRVLERFPIEVVYDDGGRRLLHKRMLVGEFDQGWQFARFVTTLTGGLLLVFLI